MQEEIKQIGEYQIIKSKRIVGMTSTGAARCNVLVQLLQTPIGKYTCSRFLPNVRIIFKIPFTLLKPFGLVGFEKNLVNLNFEFKSVTDCLVKKLQ